ncbi:restriction endonuclease subunit S [Lutibacter sp.]|uniref:restriction endonuclease subunit S n=1 Tax=Lutibacter sp. TaxID=1925666 RepID=UPI002736B9FD|nr:restriction endonuclease subunit S [Lutibacter sp.]MDP3311994.1 restriction endonuclease subunit S [Lutibacter sp.]
MNVPVLRFRDDMGQRFPEWGNSTLEEVSINYYQGINTAADKVEYVDGGVPIIQAKHITGEYLDFSDARSLNQSDYDKYKDKYNPKVNDLLISNIGTLGKVVLVEFEIKFLIAWNIFKVTLNTKKCYPLFIREFLKKIASDGYFDSIKTGNATKFINKSDMLAIEIVFPCQKEQAKIANFLTAVDEKITNLTQKHDLLTQYKKGVMQQIFSQELRFKNDDGGDFPEWDFVELEKIAVRVNKKNKDTSINNVLTNSAIQGIVSQSDYFERDIANQNNLGGYYVVETDDFVYNPRISANALVGPIKRNHLTVGVMSPLYTVFRFIVGNLDFYEQYFQTNHWHDYMKSISNTGARHDRMNITNESFYDLPLPCPIEAEQTKIANFLKALDDKIIATQTQLKAVKQYKQGLLQQMFV